MRVLRKFGGVRVLFSKESARDLCPNIYGVFVVIYIYIYIYIYILRNWFVVGNK